MNCDRCEWATAYPEIARPHCVACKSGEVSRKRRTVPFDERFYAAPTEDRDEFVFSAPDEVVERLHEFVYQILSLTDRQFSILRLVMQSKRSTDGKPSQREIAKMLGFSEALVRKELNAIRSSVTIINAIF